MEQYVQRASNEDNSIKLNVTLYIRHLPMYVTTFVCTTYPLTICDLCIVSV